MSATTSDHHRNRSHRQPPPHAHLPAMERLEDRVLLSVAAVDFISDGPLGSPVRVEGPGLADIQKLIVAGDLAGTPSDSPDQRVDPNTTDSPYAGVGSLRVDATGFDGYTYIGSATAISPTHVLTAAHMLDLNDDGTIDVSPSDVVFNLNFGSNLSHMITASALSIHPDWTGFANPSTNDDVAVIELSSPLPAGVPIYPLNTDPFVNIETAMLVGYGLSGDGVNGYTVGPSFSVKRVGLNRTDVYIIDDEGSGSREGWEFDFDGPHRKTNLFGRPSPSNLTLGNDVETTLGGGDSGGPAFIDDGFGGLEIFGINTFGFFGKALAPLFGSGGGGIVVSAYAAWITGIITGVPVNHAPVADAGADQSVTLDTVQLDGSGSSDPDGDALTYKWTLSVPTDSSAVLSDFTIVNPTFVADVDGTYVATLVVNDGTTDSAPDSATVTAGVPAAETLAITKATYNSRREQLKVEATSSLGGDAGLEATFFVGGVESAPKAMSYNAKKGKWSVTFTSADGLGGSKPEKVSVCSTTSACVEKTDVGGKSIPVATGHATRAANTTPEGIADSPVLPPRSGSTPVSVADRQGGDVSIPLTVADLPPLAVYSTTTGSQQSPLPQLVDLVSGAFEDAPADDGSVGEMDLDLHAVPLGGELMDELVLLL